MENNTMPMIVEMPVELWINDSRSITFMCSPYDLEDLALGHLFTRGIITCIDDVQDIIVKKENNQIFTYIDNLDNIEMYSVPSVIVSGTSSVSKFNDNIYKIPVNKSNYSIDLNDVVTMSNKIIEEAVIYNSTGGVHGSILATEDKYYLREDIGRHCSVDKSIGAALKDGANFSKSLIATTGRISLDMLLKSAVAGIPIISSFKYPSDMGVELANKYNMVIVSKVLSGNPLIYANKDRITNKK